ncbi:nuclear transport factor 2 family protein [Streptomyces sp. NPDC006923]|uniref:nuclear transport factor 2 family protein n=1 Tax=Streptomyces sp. NPDC006923 TaxID=3155355 RepID=UPI0033F2BFFC
MTTETRDHIDVVNVVHQHFRRCDDKDFAGARSLWADEVTIDFGGVNPDAEGVTSAETVLRSLEGLLGPMEFVQHMLTTQVVTVDGDEATVEYHLEALHHHSALGESQDVNTWTHYGRGSHGLRRVDGGWKIVSVRLIVLHHTGNANMPADIKAAKASAGE